MRTMNRCVAVVGLMITMTSAATAQVQVYTSQAAFLAAVQPGFYLESYDTQPASGTQVASPLNFSSGGFSYVATATGNPTASFFTAGPAGGPDIWLSTNNTTDVMTYTMSSANVTATGGFFFGSDIAGNFQAAAITVTLDGGNTQTFTASSPTAGSFVGFTSVLPITSVVVTADQTLGNRWPTVNDFIVGSAVVVPEPTSLALLGIPAIGFAWKRRRAAKAA